MSRVESVRRICTPLRVCCALNAAIVGVFIWLAWPAVMAEPDPRYLEDIAAEMTALMTEGQEGLENAAPIYEEAMAELERLDAKWSRHLTGDSWPALVSELSRGSWGSAKHELALQALEDGEAFFALLDRAVAVDGFTIRFRADPPGSIFHPLVDRTSEIRLLLMARLRLACMSSDWRAALEVVEIAMTGARHAAFAPGGIGSSNSYLYRRSLDELVRLTQELQAPTPFCERVLSVLEENLRRIVDPDRFIDGMALEFRWVNARGFDERGRLLTWWIKGTDDDWFSRKYGRYEDAPNLAERLYNVIVIFGSPTHEEFMDALGEVVPKLRRWVKTPVSERPSIVNLDWIHSLEEWGIHWDTLGSINSYDWVRTRQLAVMTLLRLEIYFNEHGVWPESLDELPGGAPIDRKGDNLFPYERVDDDPHGRPFLLHWPGMAGEHQAPVNSPRR